MAFDLHLISPSDGVIFWRGRYDKTQQSLSENLFDAATFFRGGGRWMKAEDLAMIGLKKILADMPGARKEVKEKKEEEGQAL